MIWLFMLILVLILILLCISIKTNHQTKKWAVLLTTAVKIKNGDSEERMKLYQQQIKRWLDETNLDIFVVESTGTGIDLPQNKRLKIFTIDIPTDLSSSQSEAKSIRKALEIIPKDYNYILKVTGRYFLKDVDKNLIKLPDADIYLQNRFQNGWQHSEYYGIRRDLLEKFIEPVCIIGLMEEHFHKFIQSNNLKFYRFSGFENNVKRGGDNLLLNPL